MLIFAIAFGIMLIDGKSILSQDPNLQGLHNLELQQITPKSLERAKLLNMHLNTYNYYSKIRHYFCFIALTYLYMLNQCDYLEQITINHQQIFHNLIFPIQILQCT